MKVMFGKEVRVAAKPASKVVSTAQIIPRQLAVVNRERASRLYHVFPFYMASLFTAIPVEAVPQVCSSIVIYHLAGLRGSFWVFCSALYLENIVGISLGMVLSATFRSVTMAPQIAPPAGRTIRPLPTS